jgi:hypothetical protein
MLILLLTKLKRLKSIDLKKIHVSNPALFLSVDISLSVEELSVGVDDENDDSLDQDDHISDVPDEDEPWTLVYSRKRGRRKLIFKNGSSSNLEP